MVGMDKNGILMPPHSSSDSGSSRFPAGLRVLAVDDDPTCLRILAQMLRKCSYEVTMCTRATEALSLLRENKDSFDLMISDVFMPDMDGFKLLEYVGLEMDLPVIMTSSHGETSIVMKGVVHGACDYLIKPVRTEELRNIWQHVVRKRRNVEASGSVEDCDKQQDQHQQQQQHQQQHQQQQQQQQQERRDDGDYASSSVNDGGDGGGGGDPNWKLSKRRKDDSDENDHDNDDPSALKKQRVVWSVELHQQFVSAVNQLGIDKAVPKKILEHMSVQGLTRENVASHLQKYRLYLRRLSGVQSQSSAANGTAANFCPPPPDASFAALSGIGSGDIRPIPQFQNSSSIQGGIGRTPAVDPSVLIQLSGSSAAPPGYFGNRHQHHQPAMLVPPPLMSIPSRSSLDSLEQISPRSPVDEFALHQFALVSNSSNTPMIHQQHQHQQQQHQHQQQQHQHQHPSDDAYNPHTLPLPLAFFAKNSDGDLTNFQQQQRQTCRSSSFGSRMAGLSLESGFGPGFGAVPSRFGAEPPSTRPVAETVDHSFLDQSTVIDGNFPVKLEGGGSSNVNQDDLFSIFLKQAS